MSCATVRAVRRGFVVAGFGLLSHVAASSSSAATAAHPETPGLAEASNRSATLLIGPVTGLTLGWHDAPDATGIPVGDIRFRVAAAPSDAVRWRGAIEIARDADWPTAVCRARAAGDIEVAVRIGAAECEDSCLLHVIDIAPAQATVSPIVVEDGALAIEPGLPQDELNSQTCDLLAGSSIASVLGLGGGDHSTSIERLVEFIAPAVSPPAMASLVEWRIDGAPAALGMSASTSFGAIGRHSIEAGPPATAQRVAIETYAVHIVAPSPGQRIADGAPVVFVAETEPPGHEDKITWLAATAHGSTSAIVGAGPMFVVQFDDIWSAVGADDVAVESMIGVRADNAVVSQSLVADERYEVAFEEAPGVVWTNAGARSVAMDAFFGLLIGPPDADGIRTVVPRLVTWLSSSAETVGDETGGISFRWRSGVPSGTWDTVSGAFTMPLEFDVSCSLIDDLFPPGLATNAAGPQGTTTFERWTGGFWGAATDIGGGVAITGQPVVTVDEWLSGQAFQATICNVPEIPLKAFPGLDACPDDRKCNRRTVCLKYHFVGYSEEDDSKTGTSFPLFKQEVESIWAKCCIDIVWMDGGLVTNTAYKHITSEAQMIQLMGEKDKRNKNKCIEVYFVASMTDEDGPHGWGDGGTIGGGTAGAKIEVSDEAVGPDCVPPAVRVLAHEVGHAIGGLDHPPDDPDAAGTIMAPSGVPGGCPGLNTALVAASQCKKLKMSPLAIEKQPKDPCCEEPDM